MIDALEYLEQIKWDKAYISSIEAEIEILEGYATSITAPMGREPVQTSGVSDKVGECASKVADLIAKKEELKKQLIDDIEERTNLIKRIDDLLQYEILHMRYIRGLSVKEIAAEKHFCEVWISKNHTKALEKVQNLLNCLS